MRRHTLQSLVTACGRTLRSWQEERLCCVANADVRAQAVAKNIRVVVNAGALDPVACKAQIDAINASLGLNSVRVSAVWGDDITPDLPSLGQHLRSFALLDHVENVPEKGVMTANV